MRVMILAQRGVGGKESVQLGFAEFESGLPAPISPQEDGPKPRFRLAMTPTSWPQKMGSGCGACQSECQSFVRSGQQ